MSICACWQLLQSTTSGAADGRSSQEDLISGAQEYLERGHVAYMQRAIQAERAQVTSTSTPPGRGGHFNSADAARRMS